MGIQHADVELGNIAQFFLVQYSEAAVLAFEDTFCGELSNGSIDVDVGQANGVSEVFLGDREEDGVVFGVVVAGCLAANTVECLHEQVGDFFAGIAFAGTDEVLLADGHVTGTQFHQSAGDFGLLAQHFGDFFGWKGTQGGGCDTFGTVGAQAVTANLEAQQVAWKGNSQYLAFAIVQRFVQNGPATEQGVGMCRACFLQVDQLARLYLQLHFAVLLCPFQAPVGNALEQGLLANGTAGAGSWCTDSGSGR